MFEPEWDPFPEPERLVVLERRAPFRFPRLRPAPIPPRRGGGPINWGRTSGGPRPASPRSRERGGEGGGPTEGLAGWEAGRERSARPWPAARAPRPAPPRAETPRRGTGDGGAWRVGRGGRGGPEVGGATGGTHAAPTGSRGVCPPTGTCGSVVGRRT